MGGQMHLWGVGVLPHTFKAEGPLPAASLTWALGCIWGSLPGRWRRAWEGVGARWALRGTAGGEAAVAPHCVSLGPGSRSGCNVGVRPPPLPLCAGSTDGHLEPQCLLAPPPQGTWGAVGLGIHHGCWKEGQDPPSSTPQDHSTAIPASVHWGVCLQLCSPR